MSDEEQIEKAKARYTAAMHAMQSGVLQNMNNENSGRVCAEPHEQLRGETSPKHLRVGVNSALMESGVLGRLLVRKGIITELEYFEEMAAGAEAEQLKYEAMLSHAMYVKVTLR